MAKQTRQRITAHQPPGEQLRRHRIPPAMVAKARAIITGQATAGTFTDAELQQIAAATVLLAEHFLDD